MIRLEEYVFTTGSWNSIDALEESITLEELHRLFLVMQRKDYEQKSFAAALKGIQMDPYQDPDYADATTFDELKERVAAKQREASNGATSSYPELEAMGLQVEEY